MSDATLRALTAAFGERDRVEGRLLGEALLELLARERIDTSVLWRGSQGFGPVHGLREDRELTLSEDLPVIVLAVDRVDRIESLAGPAGELLTRGLLSVQRVASGPPAGGGTLTVFVGRGERIGGRPAYAAVCELLHRHGAAGAIALLGVDGTRDGRRTRAALLGANRAVPVAVVAAGAGEALAAAAAELARLTPAPRLLGAPFGSDVGSPYARLSVITSQAATIDGVPLDAEIVRRLRREGIAGATSLRGVWGFWGGAAPRGDRLLQLRRRVPVLTFAVDTGARIADARARVDEIVGDRGLVFAEPVADASGL